MKNKRDMYIDYSRTYKRRGKRNSKKIIVIIVIFLICVLLGTAAYLGIVALNERKSKAETEDQQKSDDPSVNKQEEQQLITPTITTNPTATPTLTPTPTSIATDITNNSEGDLEVGINSTKVKGIYVTAPTAGTNYMEDLIELAQTSEINAMVVDVKDDHGKISYRMNDTMADQIGADTNLISDIDSFIKLLKEKDIYVIARIVAFKDPYLAEQRQDMAVKNKDGSLYRDSNGEGWVNPYNKEVWDYLVEIASYAAGLGFDEIQFDYIRFSTGSGMSEVDFGEEALNKSKQEIITEFTKYIYEKIKPLGVYVSADVYGTIISSTQDAGLVGQDYVEMAKYLDYICPMIYPSHFGKGNYGIENPDLEPYNMIRKVLTASKEKLAQIPEGEHCAIVRPWLQDFTATWIDPHMEYGGEELREQIKGVYAVDYEEWLLWNASCRYSEEGLNKE
jgi:hypothetical protein